MFQVNHLLFQVLLFASVLALRPSPIQASSSERTNRPARRKGSVASFLSPTLHDESLIWREIRPPCTRYELDPAWSTPSRKQPRKLVWFGRYDLDQTWVPPSARKPSENLHPLRSQQYTLQVQWTGRWDRGLPQQLQLDFDSETGLCRAMTSQADVLGVGEWQLFPWGLSFTLIDASGAVEYTFTAQLHLNPFGEHAKLLQGSILRHTLLDHSSRSSGGGILDPVQDEPWLPSYRKWFRPVVGKFSGRGEKG